jgi:hypothetical protein
VETGGGAGSAAAGRGRWPARSGPLELDGALLDVVVRRC